MRRRSPRVVTMPWRKRFTLELDEASRIEGGEMFGCGRRACYRSLVVSFGVDDGQYVGASSPAFETESECGVTLTFAVSKLDRVRSIAGRKGVARKKRDCMYK